MDHDALKLDRSAFDANLERAKPTVVSAYSDPIVIGASIYIGFAEIYPAVGVLGV
jgi:hypothetical protein